MKNTKILSLGLLYLVFASLAYANPIDFSKEINWMQNPAAKYCEDLGYDYVIVSTPQGELGLCRFNEADNATDLDFLTGKAKTQYSYCARKGFETKTIQNQSICHHPFTSECAVCVMPDGREKEVTALLSQDLRTQ
ncbi:MAG: DUF333 domain-containing protein, partial [Candidatus Altiarchaeales archaeon]|nr:DUF333 domain-containing protein [Candidatus Altiarchaeales archaeon]